MKCFNCDQPAEYKDEDPSYSTAYFCGRHLPLNLRSMASSYIYREPVQAPKSSKKKSSSVEEPVVDEAPVEEPVEATE